jgi:hypothetical protein
VGEANDADRALTPPTFRPVDVPIWICGQCDYRTPGSVDQPFDGDGTCPDHPRTVLRLAPPGAGAPGG